MFLPAIKKVVNDGILLYATTGTHKFLKANGIASTGRLIRRFAVDTGTYLITDIEVAYHTLEKLSLKNR